MSQARSGRCNVWIYLVLALCACLLGGCAGEQEPAETFATQSPASVPVDTLAPSTPVIASADPEPTRQITANSEDLLATFLDQLDTMPDFWIDWLPDCDLKLKHVKRDDWSMGKVTYETQMDVLEIKALYEDLLEEHDWDGGSWSEGPQEEEDALHVYELSEFEPRKVLNITMTERDGLTTVAIEQRYRPT